MRKTDRQTDRQKEIMKDREKGKIRQNGYKRYMFSGSLRPTSFINIESHVSLVVIAIAQ